MIGRRIVAARALAGIRQPELARRTKVTKQTIGNWERGRSEPSVSDLIRLADALGVTVEWLVRGNRPTPVPALAVASHELRDPDEPTPVPALSSAGL